MPRAYASVVLCLAMLLVVAAGPAAAQSKTFEQTIALEPGGSLRLDASKGSVKLTSWDRSEVEIRARIEADSRFDTDYARRAVEATTVDVDATGSFVRIRSNYDNVPGHMGWFDYVSRSIPNIHYEIRAPKRLDLDLDIDRSPMSLTGFDGRVRVDADRSEVSAADLTGRLHATIDRGGTSTFKNVRGSLGIDADRTDLRIDVASLDAASSIQIDRGDVDLALAERLGIDLETRLSRRADLDTSLPIQSNAWGRRNVTGRVNGGGPRFEIEADRGRIRIR